MLRKKELFAICVSMETILLCKIVVLSVFFCLILQVMYFYFYVYIFLFLRSFFPVFFVPIGTPATLTEVFSWFFLSCKANTRV